MKTGTILDEIVDWKREEVACRKQVLPLVEIQADIVRAPAPRSLANAVRRPGVSLIAEIKRASPSKGLLRPDLDPSSLACEYEANGACAISVLTDQHFFRGHLAHLCAVRKATSLPVLRKDFILDPYQVYEARAAGADAVLLIVAVLNDAELESLYGLVRRLGMDALVEVHDEAELERALAVEPHVVGVNNRDLQTFKVDLGTTARLRERVPGHVSLVAESGVHNATDVACLADMGADAMLVGEALVRAEDVGAKVRELVGAGG